MGETIREGQGGGWAGIAAALKLSWLELTPRMPVRPAAVMGRIVGDELQDIIDKEFHLIADHFEGQGAGAAEARQIGDREFAVAVEAGSDIFDENVGDEAPLEAIDHAEVEIIFGRSGAGATRPKREPSVLGRMTSTCMMTSASERPLTVAMLTCVGLGTALLPLMAKLPTWVVQLDRGRRCRPG